MEGTATHGSGFSGEVGLSAPSKAHPRLLGPSLAAVAGAAAAGFTPEATEAGEPALAVVWVCEAHAAHCGPLRLGGPTPVPAHGARGMASTLSKVGCLVFLVDDDFLSYIVSDCFWR